MLELKNISKQFGQHKIFDNYNLTVHFRQLRRWECLRKMPRKKLKPYLTV